MKKYLLAAVAMMALAAPASANAASQSPTVRRLIEQYREIDELCRDADGEAYKAAQAQFHCMADNDARIIISNKLVTLGWCFGERNQSDAEMQWYHCNMNSCGIGDNCR